MKFAIRSTLKAWNPFANVRRIMILVAVVALVWAGKEKIAQWEHKSMLYGMMSYHCADQEEIYFQQLLRLKAKGGNLREGETEEPVRRAADWARWKRYYAKASRFPWMNVPEHLQDRAQSYFLTTRSLKELNWPPQKTPAP